MTEGLWLSHRVCGCHRGSVAFTDGMWLSQRVEVLWLSQRVCVCHRGSVVVTEGRWFSQRVMGGERPVSWGVVIFAIKR